MVMAAKEMIPCEQDGRDPSRRTSRFTTHHDLTTDTYYHLTTRTEKRTQRKTIREDNRKHMTMKEHVIKLVEAIEDEDDLERVKRLVQGYAARSLNKRYNDEKRENDGKEKKKR